MTWKDKLEIGLKEDAPYRRDNLPDTEKTPGGPLTKAGDPSRSPVEPGARERAGGPTPRVARRRKRPTSTRAASVKPRAR